MLLIETFMLDPAKLATNCVSASGSISLRLAEALNAAPACDSDGKYAPERRRLEADAGLARRGVALARLALPVASAHLQATGNPLRRLADRDRGRPASLRRPAQQIRAERDRPHRGDADLLGAPHRGPGAGSAGARPPGLDRPGGTAGARLDDRLVDHRQRHSRRPQHPRHPDLRPRDADRLADDSCQRQRRASQGPTEPPRALRKLTAFACRSQGDPLGARPERHRRNTRG